MTECPSPINPEEIGEILFNIPEEGPALKEEGVEEKEYDESRRGDENEIEGVI